jgi:ABC-2 type transport system permease protein
MWFNGAISDCTRAFLREAKLIRSTKIPRTIWVVRLMLSKGIEFVLSIPVVILFAIIGGATLHWEAVYSLLAIVLQATLIVGLGLIIAPLVVFFRDLERAIKLVLRFLFYASPIIYALTDLQHLKLHRIAAINPLSGIFTLYRSAFFPEELDWFAVLVSAVITVAILGIGIVVFRRTEHAVLKEI